ncbi:glutamate--tRNA ligase [Sulfurimonas sp.]|uniref:glutamate--tRNA ligase n=1 Tax=Sulfurimonas sp. TaxID=2022749 RepID=UPI0026123453|nr:glutamate--tRNA ligase [Sulfurimonas sp.]
MLRFAQSPTTDMSIEDLRIVLLNYIVAKQKKEDLIVRIEDTDKHKNIEGKDQEILDILGLFGITHSQVIYQSQNFKFHSAMALQLLHEKKAFACFCSVAWLQNKRQEAKAANKTYNYDDACRNLPAELVIDNTNPFTIRINRPDEPIVIDDRIKGKVTFSPDKVDSFVIMHQDKTPTYNFACAVDDMLSDISIIICSEEQINNSPKQEHVRNTLGYNKKIEYAHLPSFSKKESSDLLSVKRLLEEGYLPEAISNYLISTCYEAPKELFTLEEVVEWFTLDRVSKNPTHFDIDRLKHINKEYLKAMQAKELSRYVGFADAEIGELARLYLDEVNTTLELKSKIMPIFEKRNIPKKFEEQAVLISKTIKTAPYFEEYDDFKDYLIKETGVKEKYLVNLLYLLLTNAEHGPDISKVYKYLKNYLMEIIK